MINHGYSGKPQSKRIDNERIFIYSIQYDMVHLITDAVDKLFTASRFFLPNSPLHGISILTIKSVRYASSRQNDKEPDPKAMRGSSVWMIETFAMRKG